MREEGLRAKAVRGYRAKVGVHRFYSTQPNLLTRGAAPRPR